MYNYWITEQVLKDKGYVHKNVPANVIKPQIERAQKLDIMPVLGDALYNKIANDLATTGLNGNYKYLFDEYVQDVLINAVMGRLVVLGTYQLYTKGMTQKRDEFGSDLQLSEVKQLSDIYINDADAYKIRLVEYLCKNSSNFAEYKKDKIVDANGNDYHVSIFLD